MSQQEKRDLNKKNTQHTELSAVRQADPQFARECEKYDYPLPSREYILQILTEAACPMTGDELALRLDIQDHELNDFARRMGAMERAGQVMCNRRGAYILPDRADLIPGRVEGHPDGFGFLIPDDASDDLFLGPRAMREVLHGDRALVRAVGIDGRGRREAKIIEVLSRANSRIVGRVVVEQGVAYVTPENRRINQNILLTPEAGRRKAVAGQIVTVEITQQPGPYAQPIGRIVETLGNYADDGMEIEIALRKHDMPYEFSPEAKAEARKLPAAVRKKDWIWHTKDDPREDIRHLPLVTIDGETARDFDDAVYCEKQGRGYRLLVAIADVSHYVQPGTALDRESLSRGNSVYFPRRVIPMLPEKISNGLCSLNPEVERLCMVCDMSINTSGVIKAYRFYPAVMFSHARLTYNKVAAALYEQDEAMRSELAAVLPQLENLDVLFRILLKARAKRGAIEFETVETRMVFDAEGKIERIVPESRNDAHRLIEECMLAANVCASEFLEKNGHPSLYRVHGGPTAEKLENLRQFLAEFGLTLGGGEDPQAADFAKVVDKIKDRPDAKLIQTVMLRSMQQAVYSPDNVGHFGLAYEAYTHFTSPIRRYPDLLVHRAIKAVLSKSRYTPAADPGELLKDTRRRKGRPNRSEDAEFKRAAAAAGGRKATAAESLHHLWEDIGIHCSQTERRADEASRDVESWLKCYYMQDRVGETYTGNITAVVSFGIFVTLDELFVEGLVHISDLGADYFHFDEARHELLGERTGQRFRLADRVSVQLVRVDLESRKIDFRLVEGPARATVRTGKTERDQQRGQQIGDTAAPAAEDGPVGWRDIPGMHPGSKRKGAEGGRKTPARTPDKPAAKRAPKAAAKAGKKSAAPRKADAGKSETRPASKASTKKPHRKGSRRG